MLADLGADVCVPAPAGDDAVDERAADVAAYDSVFGIGKRQAPAGACDPGTADIILCGDLAEVTGLVDVDSWIEQHPRSIVVSVTPFGATGPFRNRPSSDLVNIAMSGYLHMTGREDGPPLKSSAPFLSWRHACNHALAGVLLAIRHRRQTGRGTHVDVAARETGLWMLTHTYQYWDMQHINLARKGSARDVGRAGASVPSVYACKDGVIVWVVLGGRLAQGSLDKLVDWMASEGMAPDWLRAVNWMTLDLSALESVEAFVAPFAAFFRTKTADELLARAIRDGFMLAPAYQMEKLLDDPQLEARGAWALAVVDGTEVRVPAAPGRFDGFAWGPRAEG
jgi:crotonobetainyl-CoA:carnitine CoA-transferase CaiB-like acyl-CoA transferase